MRRGGQQRKTGNQGEKTTTCQPQLVGNHVQRTHATAATGARNPQRPHVHTNMNNVLYLRMLSSYVWLCVYVDVASDEIRFQCWFSPVHSFVNYVLYLHPLPTDRDVSEPEACSHRPGCPSSILSAHHGDLLFLLVFRVPLRYITLRSYAMPPRAPRSPGIVTPFFSVMIAQKVDQLV